MRPTEDQMLDAACAVFAAQGFANASMEAIARRARASKETLYAWFENKETLLNTLIASRLDGMVSRVVAAAEIDLGRAVLGKHAFDHFHGQ